MGTWWAELDSIFVPSFLKAASRQVEEKGKNWDGGTAIMETKKSTWFVKRRCGEEFSTRVGWKMKRRFLAQGRRK